MRGRAGVRSIDGAEADGIHSGHRGLRQSLQSRRPSVPHIQHIISINSDFLKLDGSIIRGCAEDPRSANLIELISGWKKLSNRSVQIIAEYVENEGIQHLLLEMGIDFSQGYLFSKPEPEIGAR